MSRYKTFLSLNIGDQLRLTVATCLLFAVQICLKLCSFDWLQASLARIGDAGSHCIPGSPSKRRIARTVDIADNNLPGDRTCLVRSLSTDVLLRAYNHSFEHRIGVEKTAGETIKAHSWIEDDGEILIGYVENLDAYEPLPSLATKREIAT